MADGKDNGVGTTNISIEIQKGSALLVEQGFHKFTRIERPVAVHIITPLKVTGGAKLKNGVNLYSGQFECEILPHFDGAFTPGRFPKEVSRELEKVVHGMVKVAQQITERDEIQPEWRTMREITFNGINLELHFRFW